MGRCSDIYMYVFSKLTVKINMFDKAYSAIECLFLVYRNKNMKLPVETGSLVVTQVTLAAFYFTLNSQVLLTVTLGLVFLAEKVS